MVLHRRALIMLAGAYFVGVAWMVRAAIAEG
jgi:hypothetical protein